MCRMDNVVRSFRDTALEDSNFNVVVVRDSVEVIGGPQVCEHLLEELHTVVKNDRAQARGVILLALERAPEDYTYLRHQSSNSLPAQASETLQVVDCFSDPLGWQDNQNPDSIPATLSDNESDRPRSSTQASREGQSHEEAGPSGRVHNVHGKIDFVRNGLSVVRFGGDRGLEELKAGIQRAGESLLKDAASGRLALVIDSMSTLLRYCSPAKVLAFLEWLRWSRRISVILTLLHADLHDSQTNAAFERLASTVIDVQAPPLLDEQGSADGRIYVRHKTRKSKVRHEREQFWLEPLGIRFGAIERTASVSALVAKESSSMQSGRAPPPPKAAVTPEVPFNLELSDAEKASRARVVLPYEHRGDGRDVKIYDGRPAVPASQARSKRDGRIGYESSDEGKAPERSDSEGTESGGGHILYTRDSDEEPPDSDEDPDDDLDI